MQKKLENFENNFWKVQESFCNDKTCKERWKCSHLHKDDKPFCYMALPPKGNTKCSNKICNKNHLIEVAYLYYRDYKDDKADVFISPIFNASISYDEKIEYALIIVKRKRYKSMAAFLKPYIDKIKHKTYSDVSKGQLKEFYDILNDANHKKISELGDSDDSEKLQYVQKITSENSKSFRVNKCSKSDCIITNCSDYHYNLEARCKSSKECSDSKCKKIHSDIWNDFVGQIEPLVKEKNNIFIKKKINDFLEVHRGLAYKLEIAEYLFLNYIKPEENHTFSFLYDKIYELYIEISKNFKASKKNKPEFNQNNMDELAKKIEDFEEEEMIRLYSTGGLLIKNSNDALKAFENKEHQKTLDYFSNKGLNMLKNNFFIAHCLFNLGRIDESLDKFLEIKLPLSYFASAKINFANKLYQGALRSINKYLNVVTGDSEAYFLKGEILLLSGNPELAFDQFEEAIELKPDLEIRSHIRRSKILISDLLESRDQNKQIERIHSELLRAWQISKSMEIVHEYFDFTKNLEDLANKSTQKPSSPKNSKEKSEPIIKRINNYLWIERSKRIYETKNCTIFHAIYRTRPSIVKEMKILNPISLENVKREFQTLKGYVHPNIVEYYELFEGENSVHLVLEKCSINLEKLVNLDPSKKSTAPISLNMNKKCRIMRDLLIALKYLHKDAPVKCIHRDLKPENILITFEGVPKITDFGSAKFGDDEKRHVGSKGTTGWCPPELFEHSNSKSDIFVMGCIFYFLYYNGLHLFGDRENKYSPIIDARNLDSSTIQKNIDNGLSQLDNIENPEFKNLIKLMTESDPNKRLEAESLINHPFFWNNTKKTEFLIHVKQNKLISMNQICSFEDQTYINEKYKDWTSTFYYFLLNDYKLSGFIDNYSDLINAFYEIESDKSSFLEKIRFYSNEVQTNVLFFFLSRFPELILDTYNLFYKEEDHKLYLESLNQALWFMKY